MSDTKEFDNPEEALRAILIAGTDKRQSFAVARAVIFLLKQQIKASKGADTSEANAGWRPIKTAPRDYYTEFLAVMFDDGVAEYWIAKANADSVFETTELMIINPTHWMPLPEPPA
jgi:Protein of unknown function (DUF551)